MRSIELRRHSHRDPGAPHLSKLGRLLAERIGHGSGPFDRVVTSPVPRAVETAEAMGLRIDARSPVFATLDPAAESAVGPLATWAECAVAIARHPPVARNGATLSEELDRLVRELPEGGRALVISHSVVVELGTVATVPAVPFTEWGPLAGYLEGARLTHDGDRFSAAELLRVGGP